MKRSRHPQTAATLVATLLLAIGLVVSGCGSGNSVPEQHVSPGSSGPGAGQPAPGNGQDGTGTNGESPGADDPNSEERNGNGTADGADGQGEFTLVADRLSLPESVVRWYEQNMTYNGAFVLAEGQTRYLLISAGSMPTGGYSLGVRSIEQQGDRWRLEVELFRPGPTDMVTQIITYPSLLFEAPAGQDDIDVFLIDGKKTEQLAVTSGGGETE